MSEYRELLDKWMNQQGLYVDKMGTTAGALLNFVQYLEMADPNAQLRADLEQSRQAGYRLTKKLAHAQVQLQEKDVLLATSRDIIESGRKSYDGLEEIANRLRAELAEAREIANLAAATDGMMPSDVEARAAAQAYLYPKKEAKG